MGIERVKSFLKRHESFYRFLQKIYFGIRYCIESYILKTKLQEWIWKSRRGDVYAINNLSDAKHAHRQVLLDKISIYSPMESVLEVGCSAGVNIYVISQAFPGVKLYGIDINKRAIEEGKKQFERMGMSNVFLYTGKADKLKRFDDKSKDVVFTDAMLMYIGPEKIGKVLGELFRIARKAVILNEWHLETENSYGAREKFYHSGHWVYNYKKLLCSYTNGENMKFTKIADGVWNSAGWREFGWVIDIRIR